jgi:hypothetical protein
VILGVVVTYVVPISFWVSPEESVVFFTAILTINGLLLAPSWGSFAKIYEIASEPRLANFLRRHGLLRSYIFHVDFIHVAQIVALCWSGLALVICVVESLPAWVSHWVDLLTLQRLVFVGTVASTVYALMYALGAVRLMQDLMWCSAQTPSDGGPEREIRVHDGGKN